MDYSKEFDMVCRVGLWYKFIIQGVQDKFLKLIRNLHNNIRSCITVNNEVSDFFASHRGIKQGENFSPLLFAMYDNDI